MNGYQLAELAAQVERGLPVIYMSGYAGYADSTDNVVPGPFLRKPCDIYDISAVIAEVFGEEPPDSGGDRALGEPDAA